MSNLMLIIGNKNYSSWSLRPWMFMKQNKIEFKENRVALLKENTNDTLLQYDSDFKVPILTDGDLTVWDSLSILEYLSEQYLEGAGWPRDIAARANARSLCAEMHSSFFNVRNELPMNCRKKFLNVTLSTEAEQEIDRIKKLWRKSLTNYHSEGEWLFGNYTIADAMFAPIVMRFDGYNIPLDGLEESYVKMVLRQPSIVEWVVASKAEKETIAEDEM